MHIIYLHGFDNTSNSIKGGLLVDYIQKSHPNHQVHCPDLNLKPAEVLAKVTKLINELSQTDKVVLVGSSLGGYFSTHLSNQLGCPALLLNPSVAPHTTLTRFFADGKTYGADDEVFYTTVGDWNVTYGDMRWVADNQLLTVNHPNKIAVWLKTADEVLNYQVAESFYGSNGVKQLIIHEGGDHRIADFDEHLDMVLEVLNNLVSG
ncbi:YqiA/YcfP family alpha/beta fold hydrolase [Psychrobacter sp. HD31]|uniref:YqiA/YcfP family alpha/beta fold hydrolase n=1 Tax=Psychrobacter sp. HD31 TaxID=3112003 RepID=UPI003DA61D15